MEDDNSSIYLGNQTNTDNVTVSWNFTFSTVMATLLSITSFLAVSGNGMVIMVVVKHPGMRTRTNLFLMNLAVADFLVGLLLVPCAITTLINGTWVFGEVLCTIDGFFNCFCLVASIHTLMYISIHKYFSITRPYYPFKLRRIFMMMAAAWLWAGFCATITVTGFTHVEYKKGTSQCGPAYPHDLMSKIHHYIIQITNIFIPLFIMIFCYWRMFKEIRSHASRMHKNTTLEDDVIMDQQKRVFITLFIVLACFIFFWLPYHAYATILVLTGTTKITDFFLYFNPVAYMLGYMNSACNPIIYAFRSPSFREGYKEILCRTSAYLISDETILDDNTTPVRRMSSYFTFGRSSSTQDSSPRKISISSLSTFDVKGPGFGPKMNFRRGKSITELMRALPKTAKGSSIIRRDGSLVIMKAGKIVSVREAKNFTNGLPSMFRGQMGNGSLRTINGNYKADFHEYREEEIEMKTLMDEVYSRKISGSVDTNSNSRVTDSSRSDKDANENANVPGLHFEFSRDDTHEPELASCGKVTVSEEDNSILNMMPLTPLTKDKLTKSDDCLEQTPKHKRNLLLSEKHSGKLKTTKSFSGLHLFHNLEVPKFFEKSNSEKILNLMGSPLLLRRLDKRKSSLPLLGNHES